jgi:hypothetical protein
MLACQEGCLDVARWLVDEKGCDVNARDTVSVALLLRAVLMDIVGVGLFQCVMLCVCLCLCACVTLRYCHIAMRWAYGRCMSVCQAGRTALVLACREGHLDVAAWLVDEKGCDVNARRTVGSRLCRRDIVCALEMCVRFSGSVWGCC